MNPNVSVAVEIQHGLGKLSGLFNQSVKIRFVLFSWLAVSDDYCTTNFVVKTIEVAFCPNKVLFQAELPLCLIMYQLSDEIQPNE